MTPVCSLNVWGVAVRLHVIGYEMTTVVIFHHLWLHRRFPRLLWCQSKKVREAKCNIPSILHFGAVDVFGSEFEVCAVCSVLCIWYEHPSLAFGF